MDRIKEGKRNDLNEDRGKEGKRARYRKRESKRENFAFVLSEESSLRSEGVLLHAPQLLFVHRRAPSSSFDFFSPSG